MKTKPARTPFSPYAYLPLGVVMVLLVSGIILLINFINKFDISTQAPYQLPPAQQALDYYLISYADGPEVFAQNRNLLVSSAINRGFDFIFNYRREHLDHQYIQQHPILNEKTGAGFWLWKPYLILKTLQHMPDGAILMYADCGLLIQQPLRAYFAKGLSIPGKDVLLFNYNPQYYGYAARCAHRDTFTALNCQSTKCRLGHHVWAGLIVVRNSKASRQFIAQWLKYCEQDQLLKGNYGTQSNFPEFVFHQHDEAILSVLSAREAPVVNFMPIDKEFSQHINIHRRKIYNQSMIPYLINGQTNVYDGPFLPTSD